MKFLACLLEWLYLNDIMFFAAFFFIFALSIQSKNVANSADEMVSSGVHKERG